MREYETRELQFGTMAWGETKLKRVVSRFNEEMHEDEKGERERFESSGAD